MEIFKEAATIPSKEDLSNFRQKILAPKPYLRLRVSRFSRVLVFYHFNKGNVNFKFMKHYFIDLGRHKSPLPIMRLIMQTNKEKIEDIIGRE